MVPPSSFIGRSHVLASLACAVITNALPAAETTTGTNDLRVHARPVDGMLAAMWKYGRRK